MTRRAWLTICLHPLRRGDLLPRLLIGIWAVALYVFKYAPQLKRARFDLQTSMMLELQQQVKQLHENMERRDK